MANKVLYLYLFCVIWITGVSAVPMKYYMDERCGRTLTIGSAQPSIRLDLTRSSKYMNNMDCTLTVKASNISSKYPTRLLLVFREIDIKGSDLFGCNENRDVLFIYDGDSRSASSVKGLSGSFCGEREPRGGYMSSGDSLTFRFKSDWSDRDDGFKLLITPFHTGTCSSSEYRCNSGQCISVSNKCDSYRQCGESLDECEVTRTMSWIAGVVVGVIFIIVVIGVGVFCLKRFLRNRNSSGGVVKYSAAPQPTSPPMYQQPGTTPGYYPPAPDTKGYPQPSAGYYPPPSEPQGYPPQNNAYPPPYPNPQPGYAPPSNPYPYGAPTAPQ